MNLQFFIEKLQSSEEFDKFKKENPDAFLCSGFFIIGIEDKQGNKYSLDYYSPTKKKMVGFQLENGIKQIPLEMIEGTQEPMRLLADSDLSFDEMQEIILERMEKLSIGNKIQKMIFTLQNVDDVNILSCIVFLSNFGLLKVNINVFEKKILLFEKKSLFDLIKKE